jgi:hypothetical protein
MIRRCGVAFADYIKAGLGMGQGCEIISSAGFHFLVRIPAVHSPQKYHLSSGKAGIGF